MSDPNPPKDKGPAKTPKKGPPKTQSDTPFLSISSEGPLAGFETAQLCEDAMEGEFKTCATTLKKEPSLAWLKKLFQENGLDAEYFTMELLKYLEDNGQYSKGDVERWTGIPAEPKLEKYLYGPYKELINGIIAKLQTDGKIPNGMREARITATTAQEHPADKLQPAKGDEDTAHKTKPDLLVLGQD